MSPKKPSKAEAEARRKGRIRELIKALGAVLPKKLLGSNSQTHILEVAVQHVGELKLRLQQHKYGDEDVIRDACLRRTEAELLATQDTLHKYERILDIVGLPKSTEPDILKSCGLSEYSRKKYVVEHGSLPKEVQPPVVFLLNPNPITRVAPVLPKPLQRDLPPPPALEQASFSQCETQTEPLLSSDAVCQTAQSVLCSPPVEAASQTLPPTEIQQRTLAVQTESPLNPNVVQTAVAPARFQPHALPSISGQSGHPHLERLPLAAPQPIGVVSAPPRGRELDQQRNLQVQHLVSQSSVLPPPLSNRGPFPHLTTPVISNPPLISSNVKQAPTLIPGSGAGSKSGSGLLPPRQGSSSTRICEELPHFSFFANNTPNVLPNAGMPLDSAYNNSNNNNRMPKRGGVSDLSSHFPSARPVDLTDSSGPPNKIARQEKRGENRIPGVSQPQQQYGQFSVNYLHLNEQAPNQRLSSKEKSYASSSASNPYNHYLLLNNSNTAASSSSVSSWNVQQTPHTTSFHGGVPPGTTVGGLPVPDPAPAASSAPSSCSNVFFSPSKPYLNPIPSLPGSTPGSKSGSNLISEAMSSGSGPPPPPHCWPSANPGIPQTTGGGPEQFYPPAAHHEWANDFQWQLSAAAAAAFEPPPYTSGLAGGMMDECGSRSKFNVPYYNCYTLPGDGSGGGPDRGGQQKKQSFQIAHMLANNGGSSDFFSP